MALREGEVVYQNLMEQTDIIQSSALVGDFQNEKKQLSPPAPLEGFINCIVRDWLRKENWETKE